MNDPRPRSVLVIGGGASGNAVTVLLRRAGITVELVEAEPDWNVLGSGITLQGNALRVLREVGVWDEVRESGYAVHAVGLAAPDGTVFHVQQDIRTGGDDLPPIFGMQRPRLQEILCEAVLESGATVPLGTTAEELVQDASGATARFSDGTEGRYDLVVAADGVGSRTRAVIGISDKPEPTGMAIWRVPVPRPESVERMGLSYGGPCYIAGYCPTSENTIYAYLVEANRDRASIDPASCADEMRRLAAPYETQAWTCRAARTSPRCDCCRPSNRRPYATSSRSRNTSRVYDAASTESREPRTPGTTRPLSTSPTPTRSSALTTTSPCRPAARHWTSNSK